MSAPGSQYELLVRGEIGDRFGLVFEGMRLERARGRTLITGGVRDQAQLHGLIERVQELGLELASVNPLDAPRRPAMGIVTTRDGAEIFYKDWGSGPPVVLSHGWPLNADSWEAQMLFLAEHGYRCVAHDRRGHGRSTQTWGGNEMDTYADDLAALIEALDLRDAMLVGFSTGGGEVARYIGRHGTGRVARRCWSRRCRRSCSRRTTTRAACRSRCSTRSAPDRSPTARSSTATSRTARSSATTARARTSPRASATRSGTRACRPGHRNAYECIAAFSATDFRADLARFDVPTLVIHGDDDQVVPFAVGGQASAALIEGARLKVYPGAPHGITDTHKAQLGADLLEFLEATGDRAGDAAREVRA